MLACLLYAANDVNTHMSTGVPQLINVRELVWDSRPVRLTLRPGPQMTWAMWGATIQGLTHFMDLYDSVTMFFDARNLQLGWSVGMGTITNPGNFNHGEQ